MFQEISRVVTLRNVDQAWMDHLDNMDDLKEGIGLRAYGQMNPLIEYQKESSRLFEATLMRIEEETIRLLFHLRLANEEEVKRAEARKKPSSAHFRATGTLRKHRRHRCKPKKNQDATIRALRQRKEIQEMLW